VGDIGIDGVLRSAWKTFRLDAIRGVVQHTIDDLEGLAAGQVLGREASRFEQKEEMDSLRAALDACCDQLREGCGLATSPGRSMQVQSKRATDADWSESFADAPQAYRIAACKGLDASFAALAFPPGRPSSAVETL
jgi:hypothetical protein